MNDRPVLCGHLRSAKFAQFAIVASLTVWVSTQAWAEPRHQFDSGPDKVALVELYTSEGCSSCPPADRWLSKLTEGTALWQNVVPLAFHVSYWDQLGWPDRFAQARFDTRQRNLAQRADSGVYTPGMFLDGKEFRRWRYTRPRAINDDATRMAAAPGNLSLDNTGEDNWVVSFTPSSALTPRADRAYVALLGNELQNDVTRGENRGKQLDHDFVVLELDNLALEHNTELGAQAEFALRTAKTETLPNAAIAAWVVDADGNPIQAVGGPLH